MFVAERWSKINIHSNEYGNGRNNRGKYYKKSQAVTRQKSKMPCVCHLWQCTQTSMNISTLRFYATKLHIKEANNPRKYDKDNQFMHIKHVYNYITHDSKLC